MKRNPKPFSVEIKNSRVQGQRSHLPPRRLFATTPAEAPKVFQNDEPRVVPKPPAAPRILPSIVEPVWSSSEPVETARRKRPSVEANRGQMEFNLDASASEGVADAPAEARVSAEAMPQTDGALDDLEDTGGVYPVQPAQGEGVRVKSRKPRKKGSGTVEQEITSEPIPEAEMPAPSVESKVAQRRMTKRLAAAAQLQRHERWKGRLHPAAW
jgi:hypothetical protein